MARPPLPDSVKLGNKFTRRRRRSRVTTVVGAWHLLSAKRGHGFFSCHSPVFLLPLTLPGLEDCATCRDCSSSMAHSFLPMTCPITGWARGAGLLPASSRVAGKRWVDIGRRQQQQLATLQLALCKSWVWVSVCLMLVNPA